MNALKLYSYFRSSASFRVRIALNLKQLSYDIQPVHLLRGGGEQHTLEFCALNPMALVPVLKHDRNVLTQSLAMMEYLDELQPEPPLLPGSAVQRARIRALALTIACEIHPLNNLRTLNYLKRNLGVDEEATQVWYRHWVQEGLAAVEWMLAERPHKERYCFGDTPTLADCCLVPQVFNARRFNCALDDMPTVVAIHDRCMELEAFQRAAPAAQLDAE